MISIDHKNRYEETTGRKHKIVIRSEREASYAFSPCWRYTDWLEAEINRLLEDQNKILSEKDHLDRRLGEIRNIVGVEDCEDTVEGVRRIFESKSK